MELKSVAMEIPEDSNIIIGQSQHIQQVLLVAEPQILGVVRQEVIPVLPKNLQIQDLAKDLCNHKPLEIHEHLANHNLLPTRKRIPN